MKIGIDIDGVILDFERTMRVYAEYYDLFLLKKQGVVKRDEFNYLKRYDWSKEERDNFVNHFLINGTYKTAFLPGAKEGLVLLKEMGFLNSIVTARGSLKKETRYVVEKILNENQIKVDEINWAIEDKAKSCVSNGIDIMIEDNPNICLALANKGIKSILLLSGEDKVNINNPLITCVNNWGEICRLLLPYAKNVIDYKSFEEILFKKDN